MNINKLEKLTTSQFGQSAVIMYSDDKTVLLRYMNNGGCRIYVTLNIGTDSLYNGHYRPTHEVDRITARENAKADFFKRAFINRK